MDFTYGSAFSVDSPDAYETLILDALQGDASLFTRADEVEEAWSIVDPIIDAWASRRRRPSSRTTRPGRGARPRPTSCSPATAGAGGGSEPPPRMTPPTTPTVTHRRARPPLDGPRRTASPRSRQELARIWASPGPDRPTIDGEPGRHIAARTSVMNLVVVARRPELAERCAATIQPLTGRHPSRTIVIQSADPDGPSWLDARIEAHCILPREDAPETCAETIHLTAGGEAGRHLAAIVTPLIVHDLPVTVWWPGEPPFAIARGAGPAGGGRPPRRRRLDLERRRPRPAARDGRPARDDPRSSISDFALVRQSRWREAIASIFDDPDFLPYLRSLRRIAVTYGTHDETGDARVDQPRQADLPRRLARLAARPVAWSSRSRRSPGAGPAAPRHDAARAARSRPVVGRGLAATLSDGRAEVAVVVRPVVSPMPAGTTLRVELLAERRGSELRTDVTAEAETVHVRVWQDGVEVLERQLPCRRAGPTSTCSPRRSSPAAATRSPTGRSARRPRSSAPMPTGGAMTRGVTEPDVRRGRGRGRGSAPAAAERIAAIAGAPRSRRAAAPTGSTTGGSTPLGDLPAPRRRAARATRAVGGRARLVGRRPVRPARPPAVERQAVRRHPAATSAGAGSGPGRSVRHPAVPLPLENLHPFPTSEAIGAARGAAWCAAELADELRERRPAGSSTAGRSSTSSCSGSAPTATSCRSSRARAAFDSTERGPWRSRRRPTSSRTSSG